MWPSIIFGLGMIALLTFARVGKLYKFKGTKLKKRMSYALGFWFCFILYFLWQGEMQGIGKSLLLGAVLCIPWCFYKKRWLKKRIEGTTIFYKRKRSLRKQYLRTLSWAIPITILFPILVVVLLRVDSGERIREALIILEATLPWLGFGFGFAGFTSQVFILLYVVKLERKLGTPILEDTVE